MPITHLSVSNANDVAAWLLSQKVDDWKEADPAKPDLKQIKALARVYLAKAPGVTLTDLEAFLPAEGDAMPGIPKERLSDLARDAEEHNLAAGTVTPEGLLWYIGKKAIGKQGCYACHDIPGFETAKPIGMALNDWGKKDPERLAFEDAETFARTHYNIVPDAQDAEGSGAAHRRDRSEAGKDPYSAGRNGPDPAEEAARRPGAHHRIGTEGGDEAGPDQQGTPRAGALRPLKLFETDVSEKDHRPPIEEIFFNAPGAPHQSREGFLHQKLMSRAASTSTAIVPWDERLRMPQFKFARSRKKPGRDPEPSTRRDRTWTRPRPARPS